MLDVLVRNAHGNLSQKHREYAARKLGKLDRYFHVATKVEIAHTEEKYGHRVDVSLDLDGMSLRGNAVEQTVYAAIDVVCARLETRLVRLKTKLIRRHRQKGDEVPMGLNELPDHELEHDDENGHIVERRSYSAKPTSVEEAMLQMEMLDLPFFAFRNEKSKKVEVLYRREKGGVGLLSEES